MRIFTQNTLIITVFILVFAAQVWSQEVRFGHLIERPGAVLGPPENTKQSARIFYFIDTLNIPFVDDFSTNKLKYYNAKSTDIDLIDSLDAFFYFNGVPVDSVQGKTDTTFNYTFLGSPAVLDSTPVAPFTIQLFDDANNLSLQTGTVTLWPLDYTYEDAGGVQNLQYQRDTIIYNRFDTVKYKPDNASLWLDNSVFVNRSYGVDPPTIGVATFDGLDAGGKAYTLSNLTSGFRDVLTSKPIDLAARANNTPITAADSVYLSFYYQLQGLGEAPENSDYLRLEFYDPVNGIWDEVWRTNGGSLTPFNEVKIKITESKYLKRGFQFRFRSFGSLNGNLDHFNIDYVYLNEGRTANQQFREDLAFVSIGNSFIKDYTQMPYKHFVTDTFANMRDRFSVRFYNFTNVTPTINQQFLVFDSDTSTLLYQSPNSINPCVTCANLQVKDTSHAIQSQYRFYNQGGTEYKWFPIKIALSSGTVPNDLIWDNDTIEFIQKFENYYAYDDGVAERTISMVGAGAKMAVEFTIPASVGSDSLRAVYFHFPPIRESVELKPFRIMIWNKVGEDETILFQSTELYYPQYLTDRLFMRYELEQPVVVSGTYYVGFQQIQETEIYVGYDRNIDNSNKVFYNTANLWYNLQEQSGLAGSVMIRPEFGEPVTPPASVEVIKNTAVDFVVFPNPVGPKTSFRFQSNQEQITINIYDLNGRLMHHSIHYNGSEFSIQTANLQAGMYIVEVQSPGYGSTRKKIIKY